MMHRRSGQRKRWAVVVLLVAAGCPRRFDPRAEPVTSGSSNPEADRAYHEARAQLDAGKLAEADQGFGAFQKKYPDDPLVTSATLWQARAALGEGAPARAAELVKVLADKPPGDAIGERARLLLGLALAHGGDAQKALTLLKPFLLQLDGEPALEVQAAIAEAEGRVGLIDESLAAMAQLYPSSSPVEQRYLRERGAALVASLPESAIELRYRVAGPSSFAGALLGARLSGMRERANDAAGAKKITDETSAARARFGLSSANAPTTLATTNALGVVVSLTGKSRLIGERALRGALLAADAIPTRPDAFDLRVRDGQTSPDKALGAVEDLAREGVLAVIVGPDKYEAQAATAHAAALGLPMLQLAPDEQPAGPLVYHILRANQARAQVLATRALHDGAKRFAVLAPDNPYGKRMADAFVKAVTAGGGAMVASLTFDEKATTFIAPVKKIAESKPDAIFVPSTAQQLELVAAQLYASGLTRIDGKPRGKTAPARLLATADGASPKLIASAGRYLQGSRLAPSFYPDDGDPIVGPFVQKFRDAYGEEPTAADALAYDAVRAVRLAAARDLGPPEDRRAELARRFAAGTDPGLTGPLGFTADGERAGAPTIFTVEGEVMHVIK